MGGGGSGSIEIKGFKGKATGGWRMAGRFTIQGFKDSRIQDSRIQDSRIQKIKGVEGIDGFAFTGIRILRDLFWVELSAHYIFF